MMKQKQYTLIARSYAAALFGATRKQGILQRVREECRILAQTAERSPSLLTFLDSPQVTTEQKFELLDKVFKTRFHEMLLLLLRMLVVRDRTGHLVEILERFEELVELAEGYHRAQVTSAHTLGFQDRLKLKSVLEKYTKFHLNIDYEVDPYLIGGVVFRADDLRIDGSLRGGLDEVRRRLSLVQIGRGSV